VKRSLLICGIVIGVILTLGPAWGLLGTVFGMMHAFQTLGGSGISDPKALSGAIGETLLATTAGLVACPIGILLLAVCIVMLVNLSKEPPPLPTDAERLADQQS
jgi:hypothetical protein